MNQTYEGSKTKPHKINLERNQIVRLPEKKIHAILIKVFVSLIGNNDETGSLKIATLLESRAIVSLKRTLFLIIMFS